MRKSDSLLILAAFLPACGLRGPLYLPEQKPAANPPVAATPASSMQSADKKTPVAPSK